MVDHYTIKIAVLLFFTSSVMATQLNATCTRYGFDVDNPGVSCADIYENNPASHGRSGYYIITTDQIHFVYCDMELECAGYKGGWMRVADYDTRRGDDCPKGWEITRVNLYQYMCGSPNNSEGCYSTKFSLHNIGYNKICGKLRGYHKGVSDAFNTNSHSIENAYVDGISITLGNPRKHVWTYAVGLSENDKNDDNGTSNCPCAKHPGTSPPSFVGDHYYCESGTEGYYYYIYNYLWDGSGCLANNNCCTNIDQPWFFRQIVMKRQDDIEARLCTDSGFAYEAILVEQIQLYVQ